MGPGLNGARSGGYQRRRPKQKGSQMKLRHIEMKRNRFERNLSFAHGAVAIALALATVAAGVCPTAKEGNTNCGPSAEANCNLAVSPPCKTGGGSVVCCKISTPSNRKPGICGLPYDKTTTCEISSDVVAVVYEWFEVRTITNGCDCDFKRLLGACIDLVPCPTSQQTADTNGCVQP